MEATAQPAYEPRMVPIDQLYPSKTNPRKTFDQAKLDEMATNIGKVGLLEPLVVRQNGSAGKFEVICGERRYRAAKKAGLAELPVTVRQISDEDVLEIQIIENVQRDDLTELEEGQGYRELLKLKGPDGKPIHTVQSIATKIDRPVAHIYARMKLADAEAPVQKAVQSGKISASHAIELARIHDPKDQVEMFHQVTQREMSVARLKETIKRELHCELKAAPFPQDSTTLVPAAGSCTACSKREGGTCTDRGCYHGKTDAFLTLRFRELSASGGLAVLKISENYTRKPYNRPELPKEVLTSEQYREARAQKCEHQQKALWMDGSNIGKTATVCTEKKCKTHWGASQYGPSPAELARRKAAEAKARLEAKAEKLAVAAVVAKVTKPAFSRSDLAALALCLFGEMHNDKQKELLPLFAIEPKKQQYGNGFWAATARWIEAASDVDLCKFLLAAVLVTAPDPAMSYHKERASALADACRRYKVDLEAIKKEVNQEATAKKAGLQTSAKPKVKAAGK